VYQRPVRLTLSDKRLAAMRTALKAKKAVVAHLSAVTLTRAGKLSHRAVRARTLALKP
jgi:hypothetical protein